ncbi:helix-turn-helix domain-containing protein [Photobacterium minamisatsumaniensis]|uniref:helix-turn-helix domain-containing protein n=1 Tax=Photobacterium minamisatsumaniensis TaxID=2910233 RepID=UPI003D0DBFDB
MDEMSFNSLREIKSASCDFSYDNFSCLLKSHRNNNKLSQQELSLSLSINHDVFENVTQSMVSQWENGKNLPSLMRRVGIATYFNVNYHYANFELVLLKRSLKNEMFYDPHIIIYPIRVTHTENIKWNNAKSNIKEQIQHAFSVRHRGCLGDFINHRELSDVKIRCYYYDNMLVGHILYCINDGVFHYICAAGMNANIHAKVLFDMKGLCSTKTVYMPATIPAIKYFLMSIYGVEICRLDTTIIYSFNMERFFSNPYVKALFVKNQDFILLSYQVYIDNLGWRYIQFTIGINQFFMSDLFL